MTPLALVRRLLRAVGAGDAIDRVDSMIETAAMAMTRAGLVVLARVIACDPAPTKVEQRGADVGAEDHHHG